MLVYSSKVCYLYNTSIPKHVSVGDFIYFTYMSHVYLWESPSSRLYLCPHPTHSDGQTAARGSVVGKATLHSLFLSSISSFHLGICEQSGFYQLWEEDRSVHLGLAHRVFKSSLVPSQTFYKKPHGEQTNRKAGILPGRLRTPALRQD